MVQLKEIEELTIQMLKDKFQFLMVQLKGYKQALLQVGIRYFNSLWFN